MKYSRSILFSSIIYSVLLVLILFLFAVIFIFLSLDSMTELHAFFFGTSIEALGKTGLFLSLALILTAIYALIQMLRRKIHALYLFFALSVIIIIFILQSHPLDLISIFIISVVNFVFYINRGWFKEFVIDTHQEDAEKSQE